MSKKGWIVVDEVYCKACELCVNACPADLLELARDRLNNKGYHPVELIKEGCTGCALCASVCPEAVIKVFRESAKSTQSDENEAG
jgi:2-oxoglutarate ferredoxin oxidoreductase subunit delta